MDSFGNDKQIKEYFKYLYGHLSKHCKDKELVEDVVQKAIYTGIKKFKTFRGESKIQVWLYTIAMRQLIKDMKKKKDIIVPYEQYEQMEAEYNVQMSISAEEEYIRKEQIEEIYSYINKLNGIQYRVICARILENKSYAEIAKEFGKTENWARQLFFRTKCKLIKENRKVENDEEGFRVSNSK